MKGTSRFGKVLRTSSRRTYLRSVFCDKKTTVGDYGEVKTISTFNKNEFCKWICEQRNDASDFAGFVVVVDLLVQFLAPRTAEPAVGNIKAEA